MAQYFGEVPRYVRGRQVRSYIDRNLQLSLPGVSRFSNVLEFPKAIPAPSPVYRDSLGRKVCPTVWHQQPRRFPPSYTTLAAADPQWRRTYARAWVAKRKAQGLPHEITDRLYAAATQQEKSA